MGEVPSSAEELICRLNEVGHTLYITEAVAKELLEACFVYPRKNHLTMLHIVAEQAYKVPAKTHVLVIEGNFDTAVSLHASEEELDKELKNFVTQ